VPFAERNGLSDEDSTENQTISDAMDKANESLDSIDKKLPDLSAVTGMAGDMYNSVLPLISLLVLPCVGITVVVWLVRKHD